MRAESETKLPAESQPSESGKPGNPYDATAARRVNLALADPHELPESVAVDRVFFPTSERKMRERPRPNQRSWTRKSIRKNSLGNTVAQSMVACRRERRSSLLSSPAIRVEVEFELPARDGCRSV